MFKEKFQWGPLVLVYDVDTLGFEEIKNICFYTKSNIKKDSGSFKNVDEINGRWVFSKDQENRIFRHLQKYFNNYLDLTFKNKKVNKIKILPINVWVNYYKAKENINSHVHGSDISFVLYIDTAMDSIENEQNVDAGCTGFEYGEHPPNRSIIPINNVNVHRPKNGELIIFPGNVRHQSYPLFNIYKERVSVSGNIDLEIEYH